MIEIEIRTKGFDQALRNLRSYPQIAREENTRAMNQAVALGERVGKQNAPVGAVGELKSKIIGQVVSAGPGQVVGAVGGRAPHSAVVELGADPHWPEWAGLRLWVLRKLRVQADQVNHVTYLIGRVISRRGLKARPYLRPAIETNQDKFRKYFDDALARIVARLAK